MQINNITWIDNMIAFYNFLQWHLIDNLIHKLAINIAKCDIEPTQTDKTFQSLT